MPRTLGPIPCLAKKLGPRWVKNTVSGEDVPADFVGGNKKRLCGQILATRDLGWAMQKQAGYQKRVAVKSGGTASQAALVFGRCIRCVSKL